MIRNYLIIALRSLWRNKLVSAINLLGMAIGFGLFLSFWSWVRFDLGFDEFHEDIDQMYILNLRLTMNGSEYKSERTGGVFASVLNDNFPQVLSSCRVSNTFEFELGIPADEDSTDVPMNYFNEEEVLMVDSTFFNFFTFHLVKGDREQIFSARDHMVITESLAGKLFGDKDPMNQMVRVGEGGYYQVAGVVEDPPDQSTFQFNVLLGFHVMEEMGYPVDGHTGTIYYNNFKLAPGTDVPALNIAINEYYNAHFDQELDAYFYLDKFSRVHLHGERGGVIGLYMNMIMSLVILSIACINFINLTTAYSSERVKEIAIRKSTGATKGQLIVQFMGETYILLLVAFYLGLFISEHLVPETSRLFGISLKPEFSGAGFWLQLVTIYLLTGLLAGLYPAVKIAGFKPLAFLSGKNGSTIHGRSWSRRILIVLQFTFSVVFITVSIFMIRQYNYLNEADLGFNRENVIFIRTTGRVWDRYSLIKRELTEMHFVEGVTTGSSVPVWIDHGETNWGEKDGEHNKIAVVLWTDADFLSTFEIDLLEGEYYSGDQDSLNDSYVVVNQSLVDLLGWEDPVGRSFYMYDRQFQILGVTENINFFPFNLEIFNDQALIYRFEKVREYIFVRVNQKPAPEMISDIESLFRKYNPGYEFNYDYVSDYKYEALKSADGIKFITKLFSVMAIFIAVIGLIGLSIFTNIRRTKEMGIRKVMGAQTGGIMQLLLSEFIKLVVLSNVIGLPAAYLITKRLLRIFSYSIELNASVFAVVFLLSVLVSLATVSFHAFRTARANPVDSLRYE